MKPIKFEDSWVAVTELPFITTGSNFEMGYQQGNRYASRVGNWVKYSRVAPAPPVMKYIWPLLRFSGPVLGRIMGKKSMRELARYLPGMAERMEGISAGAGYGRDLVVFQNTVEVLGAHPLHTRGCSSCFIGPGISGRGEPLFVKNFDFLPFFGAFQILRISRPVDGLSSIEMSMSSLAGSHAGLNESGLVLLYNYAFAEDRRRKGIPVSMIVQHCLETCSSVPEVDDVIQNTPRASGGIILAGDSHGTRTVFEFSNSRLYRRDPDTGYGIATNHFLCGDLKQYELPVDAKYHRLLLPAPWKGVRIHETSIHRYNDLETGLKGKSRVTVEEIRKLFSSHGDSMEGSNNSVCRHSLMGTTLSSIIIFPSSLRVMYCHGQPCEETYRTFTLRGETREDRD